MIFNINSTRGHTGSLLVLTKCLLFVKPRDRMGDTRVMSKCARAVRLCAVHALLTSIPSERRVCVVYRKKSPSFDFCQVDM